jgi:Flp pilus assembly protein TadG
MNTQKFANRKNERGSILATSAVGMLSLLLAVGLCVDISRFYLTKTELQNAADASALAAVSALNGSGTGITEAANRAVANMNNWNFNKSGVSFPRANVLFAVNLAGPYMSEGSAVASPANIRFVQVTSSMAAVDVTFAGSVLGATKNLDATATAGMSVPLNVICDWLPAFVLDYPDNPITPGHIYQFRMGPGGFVSPGDYQLLEPDASGGADVRLEMANGVRACVSPGDEIPTKPGVTAGAVRQGINTRFDQYGGAGLDPALSPPDTNVAENITHQQYKDKSTVQTPSHDGVDGRRVVFIPITKNPPGGGRNTIVLDRFGVFFLQKSVGGGNGAVLEAEYVTTTTMAGKGTYRPGAGAVNNLLAIPVLYK